MESFMNNTKSMTLMHTLKTVLFLCTLLWCFAGLIGCNGEVETSTEKSTTEESNSGSFPSPTEIPFNGPQPSPLKEVYIFLDESLTIVNDKDRYNEEGSPDQTPSKELARMFEALLAEEGNQTFLQPDDEVFIYRFDEVIRGSAQSQSGDVEAIRQELAAYKEEREGGKVTKLHIVWDKINELIQQSESGKQKVFVIASDFVHDPRPLYKNNRWDKNRQKANHPKVLEEAKTLTTQFVQEVGRSFNGENPQCFMLLLEVKPDARVLSKNEDGSPVEYGEKSASQTLGLLTNGLNAISEKRYNAATLNEMFLKAATKWLHFGSSISVANNSDFPDLKFVVENTNWFPVTLNEVRISRQKNVSGEVVYDVGKIFLPGQEEFPLDTTNWPSTLKTSPLYLTFKQTRRPLRGRAPTKTIQINNAKIEVGPTRITRLPGRKPTVHVKSTVTLSRFQKETTTLKWRVRLGNTTSTEQKLDINLENGNSTRPINKKIEMNIAGDVNFYGSEMSLEIEGAEGDVKAAKKVKTKGNVFLLWGCVVPSFLSFLMICYGFISGKGLVYFEKWYNYLSLGGNIIAILLAFDLLPVDSVDALPFALLAGFTGATAGWFGGRFAFASILSKSGLSIRRRYYQHGICRFVSAMGLCASLSLFTLYAIQNF